jgi:hypothetical protein
MKSGLPSVRNIGFHIVMDVANGADKEMTEFQKNLLR